MENTKSLELFETEIDLLINRGHRSGLNYWQILGILLEKCRQIYQQADAEYWLGLSRE